MTKFDVETELAKLKAETRELRQKRFKNSRLNFYHGELVKMRIKGATVAELQRWLKVKRISVAWTTVKRWLDNHG
ncbi:MULTISPECIES: hypothetical protein [unclassified Arsukibacterium]|uniref:hypothetical protein n=1 Tax=unclassified Arsukibacterium TaxID=2635278 RepID=UPI000C3877BD|nr:MULTISPECIES: hypothetical protein [unclassified Arsukibacterium]MAA96107.1 hypothetical protein [Rheinheimera sp.]MBM35455.1 hypothetical protein [Rheinheimera sp.]HAW93627.1 hypothetical protein [Candidatus Azambacteria bacterium]|tara:strand:+ start:336 stop:560 length:225 start_codon:yes stop_codon:yes gene_type:complete